MKSLTLGGIKYEVVAEKPYEYQGKNRVAITMKRPRGKRFYHVIRYETGFYSGVV